MKNNNKQDNQPMDERSQLKADMGSRLQEVRNLLKLNREQFSNIMGISTPDCVSYEAGERFIPVKMINQLILKYNVDANWLAFGIGSTFIDTERHENGKSTDSRRFITTGDNLPQWSNPISHAVVVNDTCYISGQLSVNTAGEYVPGSIREEAELAFANTFAAAEAAGFSKDEIVFVDIAFSDLSELDEVNRLYTELFPEEKRPARTIYQAAALPFGGKIKITATAVKDISVDTCR